MKMLFAGIASQRGAFMPVQQVRNVRPFSISAAQLDLLCQASHGRRLRADGSGDEAACTSATRNRVSVWLIPPASHSAAAGWHPGGGSRRLSA